MRPTGLWGALECVCVKEYWAFSSQMSAEQSLYTITSGHLGPINTASELQLCLFVPYCLFIIVLSLRSISSYFFSSCLTYTLPPLSACIYSFLYSSLSGRNTCILPSSVLQPVLTPLHPHIHILSFFFPPSLFLSQLVATLFFSPSPPLSSPFCAAFTCHSSWLLSKHHLLPGHQQQQCLFAIQIVFFTQDCQPVRACVAHLQQKSSCKLLYTWCWTSYTLFITCWKQYLLCSRSNYLYYSLFLT